MTKLCPRGKAAAKRKFAVYPSAYANAYASKICAGKIKDPSGVKRKDFRGPKPSKAMGGRIYKANGGDVPARLRKGGPRKNQSQIPFHRKEAIRKEFKKYGGPRPKGSGIEGRMERLREKMEQKRSRKPMMGGGPLRQFGTIGRTEINKKITEDLMRSAIEGDSKKFKKFRNPEKAEKFFKEKAKKSGIARPKMMGGGMMKKRMKRGGKAK